MSDESGTAQVYIQSFPPSGGKWQVTTAGGSQPRWRGDGKELYFHAGGMFAAGVRALGGRVEIDPARQLFRDSYVTGPPYYFDVARDGQRFLEIQPPAVGADQAGALTVVSNWQAGLKQ